MTLDEMLEMTRRTARRKPREEEHRLQALCVGWFRRNFPEIAWLLFAVPNGGRRDAATGAKLKAEGVVPGVADLILDVARGKWHGLRIEMKTPTGRQSTEQLNYQRAVEAQGYRYEVVRTFEQFIKVIDEYLNT